MTRKPFPVVVALACVLSLSTACQSEKPIDRTPLPKVAGPPYLCDYVPQRSVELMTGVKDPLVRGFFDLTTVGGLGDGTCIIYEPDGDRRKVLVVDLTPDAWRGEIEDRLQNGALPLPEIVPGAIGAYYKITNGDNAAVAILVRGKAELSVQLEIGVPGRDNAADVVALMRLLAPKLVTDASAPSASPSSEKE